MNEEEKNTFLYILEYCTNDFISSVEKYVSKEENDVNILIVKSGTAVLWIGAGIYKLEELGIVYDEDEKRMINAFKAATNALKHNFKITKVSSSAIISSPVMGAYRSTGRGSLSTFRRICKRTAIWDEMQPKTVKSDNNIKDYNQLLALKDVRTGIKEIKKIIEKYLST